MKDEYIVVNDEDLINFQLAVISKLADGYELVGGLCVTRTSGSTGITATYGKTNYYQSMVLKEGSYGKAS